jgi:RHS repeat-associated protein
VYDGLGRCVKRTIQGGTTVITYDDWKPIMEWSSPTQLAAWNAYGPGADEILWRWQAGFGYLRYHGDRHGNVTALLDYWGGLVEQYSYDAFGKPTIMNGYGTPHSSPHGVSAVGNRFMFQGREWLGELGLIDYRHRFYDPSMGRFLQMDPMGLQTEGEKLSAGQKALFSPGGSAPEAFSSSEMNLFRYCGDDPVDGSDPLGLENYGFYANLNSVNSDNETFQSRATQGAGHLAFPFATGPGVMARLMSVTNITRLDFHSHGTADRGLMSGNPTARIAPTATAAGPNGMSFTQLAYGITSGKVDIAKGANIRMFACNQAGNAQRLSAMLGAGGRSDVSVTGANGNVSDRGEKTAVVDGGKFEVYRNGIKIDEKGSLRFR